MRKAADTVAYKAACNNAYDVTCMFLITSLAAVLIKPTKPL